MSEKKTLTLTLEFPETLSSEEINKLITKSALLINDLHKSIGGKGLKLIDIKED